MNGLSSIPEALASLREGRPVLVADDESRENEGDVILAAELATQQWVAWTVRMSSGFLCAPMTNEIADALELPPMVRNNEDAKHTNYTISVDAASGVTTGISAHDRAATLRVLADPASGPRSVIRPGHILPLRAVDGGVRERAGHTEAAVELMRLAGLRPVAAIGEVIAEDGEMMRLPGLIELGEREGIPVITIADLIAYLDEHEPLPAGGPEVRRRVSLRASTRIPTVHGQMRYDAFLDRSTGQDHLAIVAGEPPRAGALVRVHSECLTGEAFGSLKCECGPQLDAALDLIDREGGVVVYLRGHEGRGIGLINKLRAYQLQEGGLDTVEANLALGLPDDARDYAAAASILRELGLNDIRLLTNNPDKVAQLQQHGVRVAETVPLIVGRNAYNEHYMQTKRDRMGHVLPPAGHTAATPGAAAEGGAR